MKKKLTLKKTELARLNDLEMHAVQGGATCPLHSCHGNSECEISKNCHGGGSEVSCVGSCHIHV